MSQSSSSRINLSQHLLSLLQTLSPNSSYFDYEETNESYVEHIDLLNLSTTSPNGFWDVSSKRNSQMLPNSFELDMSVQVLLYSVIFLLAVTGNVLVILTLVQNQAMRTITNLFLLNLAIADLLVGVLCMPFTLVGIVLKDFVFGSILCKLIPYLQAVSVSVSAWTLVAISVERYYAICHPLTSRRWQTLSHAYKIISLVWILSGIFMSPIAALNVLLPIRDTGRHKCREEWPSWRVERAYTLFLDSILLILPLVIMTVKYSLITQTLWRVTGSSEQSYMLAQSGTEETSATPAPSPKVTVTLSSPVPQESKFHSSFRHFSFRKNPPPPISLQLTPIIKNQKNSRLSLANGHSHSVSQPITFLRRSNVEKSLRRKKRVIQMLGVVVAEFFVCWTPLYIMNTWYLFSPTSLYHLIGPLGVSLVHLLAYLSSCSNPITYCFMNESFRIAFCSVFGCRCGRRGDGGRGGREGSMRRSRYSSSNSTRNHKTQSNNV